MRDRAHLVGDQQLLALEIMLPLALIDRGHHTGRREPVARPREPEMLRLRRNENDWRRKAAALVGVAHRRAQQAARVYDALAAMQRMLLAKGVERGLEVLRRQHRVARPEAMPDL